MLPQNMLCLENNEYTITNMILEYSHRGWIWSKGKMLALWRSKAINLINSCQILRFNIDEEEYQISANWVVKIFTCCRKLKINIPFFDKG